MGVNVRPVGVSVYLYVCFCVCVCGCMCVCVCVRASVHMYASPDSGVCCVQRGETALHMASRAGQVEVVRCLLRNGALVDARARVTHLTTPFTTQY